jgi:hypothetical protein
MHDSAVTRVRLADGLPLSFDETYLPKEMGEKVMADNFETESFQDFPGPSQTTPSPRLLNLNRQTLPPRTMHSSWMTSLPTTSDVMARSK